MYAEAAWPQCKASRPERIQDKEKPDGVDLAVWRLQRGIDAARAHGKRVPQCVGASALAAEMLLECLLYRQMLMPKSKAASSPAESSSSGDPVAAASHDDDDDSTCSEKEEIRALMLMAGVKSAKQLDDPATALRIIEQQRRKVVEMGGPHAASEAEELAKLHEWQMGALGRSRRLTVGLSTASSSRGDAAGSISEAAAAIELCEGVMKTVETAASSPSFCLLRGRLLLTTGNAADAVPPLAAAVTLLAPDAAWRRGLAQLLGAGTAKADAHERPRCILASLKVLIAA